MQINLVKDDITKLIVDAVVNAANTTLLGGGGVDGAIHLAAGRKLLKECKKLNGCKEGEAKITYGYNLPAKYIIHTVGPIYNGGLEGEAGILHGCYYNSLNLAAQHELKSVAFPCISTGAYGYPFEEACEIALRAIYDFGRKTTSLEEVVLVCYSDAEYERFYALYQ